MNITELVEGIRRKYPKSRLQSVDEAALAAVGPELADLPSEYFALLRELGWGSIGRDQFMIYGGPVNANEIFGNEPAVAGVVLVGDDFAGYHIGYRKVAGGWEVVEFDHASLDHIDTNASLADALTCVLSLPG